MKHNKNSATFINDGLQKYSHEIKKEFFYKRLLAGEEAFRKISYNRIMVK